MNTQRRKNSRATYQLESLESRITPSDLGASGAWQAMRSGSPGEGIRPALAQRFSPTPQNLGQNTQVVRQTIQAPANRISRPAASLTNFGSRAGFGVRPLAIRATPTTSISTTPGAGHGTPLSSNIPSTTMRMTPNAAPTPPPTPQAGDTQTPAPLPSNVSGVLNTIYQDYSSYLDTNPTGDFPPPASSVGIPISNGNVGVYVNGNGQGDFASLVSTLQNLGMQITSTNATTWTVSGMLPILQLRTAAQTPQTTSITPRYSPATM